MTDDGKFDSCCAPVPETAMATGSDDGEPGEQPDERPLRPEEWAVLAPRELEGGIEAVEDSPAATSAARDDSVLPIDSPDADDEDDPLTPEFRAPQHD
jgi:hypothetical protein